MGYFESNRPKERHVAVRAPLMYYFIHQLERANTKQFRMGESVEIGDYALCFEAKILDPSLLESAIAEEIFIETRIKLEDGIAFHARGRVVSAETIPDAEEGKHLVAIEYTEADEEERKLFMEKASELGELVDPAQA